MQIVCKDGTTIQCHDFEAIGSGVLFFREPPTRASDEEGESDDAAADQRADGFVPITELHVVVPDEMVQQPPGRAAGQEQGHPSQQPPATQPGGMAQQQQLQQFPGTPGHSTR